MTEAGDERIARALAEQRRLDERLAPDFASLLVRARPRSRMRAPDLRRALLLAAALVLIAGSAWLASRSGSRARPSGADAAAAIGNWKAPTDSLLETPGRQLLHETPALVPPVPDYSWLEKSKLGRLRTPGVAS